MTDEEKPVTKRFMDKAIQDSVERLNAYITDIQYKDTKATNARIDALMEYLGVREAKPGELLPK